MLGAQWNLTSAVNQSKQSNSNLQPSGHLLATALRRAALARNWTQVSGVAGEDYTTRPPMFTMWCPKGRTVRGDGFEGYRLVSSSVQKKYYWYKYYRFYLQSAGRKFLQGSEGISRAEYLRRNHTIGCVGRNTMEKVKGEEGGICGQRDPPFCLLKSPPEGRFHCFIMRIKKDQVLFQIYRLQITTPPT